MARCRRPKKEPVKTEWERMPEADSLARQLIEKHHKHLERATVLCLGKPKASKRGDKVNIAKARKVTKAMNALLKDSNVGEGHYLIEIGLDAWRALDKEKRKIVLDHELMHMAGQDDKGHWTTVGHDIEAFTEEIRRYGAWTAELEIFAKEARQLSLDLKPVGA
jgi:hypothetical protein